MEDLTCRIQECMINCAMQRDPIVRFGYSVLTLLAEQIPFLFRFFLLLEYCFFPLLFLTVTNIQALLYRHHRLMNPFPILRGKEYRAFGNKHVCLRTVSKETEMSDFRVILIHVKL